jgi:hypothetical protein
MIVTSMWSEVTPEVGNAREKELRNGYFKPLLDAKAVLYRHDNKFDTACQIIRKICAHDPLALNIQTETIDEEKPLPKTSAGIVLRSQLLALAERIQGSVDSAFATLRMAARDEGATAQLVEHVPLLAHLRNEIRNLDTVTVPEDIDVSKEWENMKPSRMKITTLLRRCYGKEDTPKHTAFWFAMGDTTKVIGQIYSIFQEHPIAFSIREKLLDVNSALDHAETKRFKQWLFNNSAAVKDMKEIMNKAIIIRVGRTKKRITLRQGVGRVMLLLSGVSAFQGGKS